MYKFQIFFLIIVFQLFRAFFNKRTKGSKHLLISFFIITIPFQYELTVITGKLNSAAGTLGTKLNITIPFLLFLFLFLVSKYKIKSKIKFSKWFRFTLILIIISLINPYNNIKFATIIFAFFLLSHFLFFYYISRTLNQREIILGFFDGFFILCVLQVGLAICFPLLGIKEVTTMVHTFGEEGATRMGTRIGAIGFFTHPGNLALFTTIASTFFLGCYLNNYKKKISLLILGLNVITLILTYSRTSFLVFVIDLFLVYYICQNAKKNILTFSNFFKFICPIIGILIYIIFFSPLSDFFLKSDANEMFDARLIHWYMGSQTFLSSPVVGVGLNTHLEYMFYHYSLFEKMDIGDFFWENPIHNIHLIVLVETGILGFVLWIAFIFNNISKCKEDIANKRNKILSATQIGLLAGVSLYGFTGWAPFSKGFLPFLLMISFFAIQFRNSIKTSSNKQLNRNQSS